MSKLQGTSFQPSLTESMTSLDSVGNNDLTVDVHRPATSGVKHASVALDFLLLLVGQLNVALVVFGVSIEAGFLLLSQLRREWRGSHLEEHCD